MMAGSQNSKVCHENKHFCFNISQVAIEGEIFSCAEDQNKRMYYICPHYT